MAEDVNVMFKQVRGELGSRIRELRLYAGLSQEELADRAGCHPTYISMLERSKGNPSLLVLSRIAGALNTTICSLIGEAAEVESTGS